MAKGKRVRLALYAQCTAVLLYPSVVFAQTTDASAKPLDQPERSRDVDNLPPSGLQDIVVTARRVEESQLTVPISITAFAGNDLDRRQIRSTDDLATRVPSLQVVQGATRDNSFTIRSVARTFQSDPGVVTYVADVPQETFGGAPILDLASVQVLKGPQGTLFGKNSIGGAVLLVPQRPKAEFEGSVSARFGNFGAREATGMVNLPLGDTLAIRAAGRYTRRDGLLKNVSGPALDSLDRGTARLSILYTPSSTFENYLIVDGYKANEVAPAPGGIITDGGVCPQALLACLFGAFGMSFEDAVAAQKARGIDHVSLPETRKSRIDVWGITNQTTLDLGTVTIKNIAAYRYSKQHIFGDFDGSPIKILGLDRRETHDQFTEELQFRGALFDDKLDWTIGGFYSNVLDKISSKTFLFEALPPGVVPGVYSPTLLDNSIRAKSLAAFGQATYDLSGVVEGLKLTGGLRYTRDTRHYIGSGFDGIKIPERCRNVYTAGPNAGSYLPGTDPATCKRTLDVKAKRLTWNANLEYRLSPSVFTYLTARRGYKSGNVNAAATSGDLVSFRPETLTDVEFGIKSQGRIGSMPYSVSAAAYTGKYKDIQSLISYFVDGSVQNFVLNVGGASIKGFELEATIIPVPGIELGGYYAETHGKYDKDVDLGPLYAGKALIGVAKRTAGFNARFTTEAPLGTLSLTTNVNYRGPTPNQYFNAAPEYQAVGGFATVDATAEIRNIGGSEFWARFYVQNLLNDRSAILSNDGRIDFGFASRTYLPPRTFGIEGGVKF